MTDLHLALVTEWRRSCSGKAASRGRKRRTGICGIRAVPGRPGVRYYATGKGARGRESTQATWRRSALASRKTLS